MFTGSPALHLDAGCGNESLALGCWHLSRCLRKAMSLQSYQLCGAIRIARFSGDLCANIP